MQVRSLGGEDPLEEGMATHSSILAWRIPWTEEPGGLQSLGLCRAVPLRRQWHPTPVLLPGKSHGWKSLVGCSPWGRLEGVPGLPGAPQDEAGVPRKFET